MTAKPAALVLDDGELEEVRAVLQDLGVEYAYLRGATVPDGFEPPESGVLITTARRALALASGRASRAHRLERSNAGDTGRRLVRIVVVGEESRMLRAMLRGVGFDFLVRQPVHRVALRLLLLRALYRGPERRRVVRLPVGCDVRIRAGVRRRRASLVEISARGCRLIAPAALETGSAIEIVLPRAVTGDRALELESRVVRCRPGADGGGFTVGLSFPGLDAPARARLQTVLKAFEEGPAMASAEAGGSLRSTLSKVFSGRRSPGAPRREPPVGDAQALEAEPAAAERRRQTRYSYERRVIALQDEAERVLMGRDLSLGGMRVDPQDEIEIGDRLELAIYGPVEEQPLVVHATVARADGAHGLGLVFDKPDEATAARLETIVATLPPVEALCSDETENLGAVVSEIRSRG